MNARQNGSHLVGFIILLLVVGVLALIFYRVFGTSTGSPQTASQPQQATGSPVWAYNQQELAWSVSSGTAPACNDPFVLNESPVDMAKITAVSLPGAYRGFSYKAHGGFRASDATNGSVDVKMPMDAKLMGITRYYERVPGSDYELQYLIDFENDCGIAFRFDHIHTLTPALQAYADKTPEPKKDDTRRDQSEPIRQPFKAGDVIATRVGFVAARNFGFDFGVYDLRQRNKISANAKWAAIHKEFSAQHYHGVCWLPTLPGDDAAKAEAMAKDRANYNSSKPFNLTSDYCDFAPHTTLDFNGGQPTDG